MHRPNDRRPPGPPERGGRDQGRPDEHPGNVNYPVDRSYRPTRPVPAPPHTSRNPHLGPLPRERAAPHRVPASAPPPPSPPVAPTDVFRSAPHPDPAAVPKKLTVTRVAALRARELSARGAASIHRAATADGADKSGLTALTVPVVVNFAVDAAMTVALANTLFFAAASAESKGKVALYLLLTIAPFAFIAPLIGPALDRLQRGRRIAMATTFGLRVLLAIIIIVNSSWDPRSDQLVYDPWVLYPAALGMLVLSKSFGVLKSAVTPRVLPPTIDLVRVNSRLTTFGLLGGTIAGGAVAALFETVLGRFLPLHIPGAMLFLAVIAGFGAMMCMRIPSWVESTAGEIPATLSYHGEPAVEPGQIRSRTKTFTATALATMRQPLGRTVLTGLWGNGTIRILTGFLTLYIAFYAKSNPSGQSGGMQLLLLGSVGAAAGIGNFAGNALGTRMELKNPQRIVVLVTVGSFAVALLAAIFGSVVVAAFAALIASGTSAIGKVCLDASIQDDLPDESRASAFGRSESVLQLCWVAGAAMGVLLPPTLWIGFTVVTVVMAFGLAQTLATNAATTLVPGFGGNRPAKAMPTGGIPRLDPDAPDAAGGRPVATDNGK
ncbi:MFS transporter [Williamsia sp. CHRR-6]|uniref:MFS transporter n=1 Tax=Williamsia sp. CHRR-6 TaxID=2835871 RepID=UPI001BD9932B|nr:MFS transporter [Williamsia sp. CHRR-6]MBT0566405.1 MFS transporter [Williamsia sp. CHRR-6]